MLMNECNKIMGAIDSYDHPLHSSLNIIAATATSLIMFSAKIGGEPVRLQIY